MSDLKSLFVAAARTTGTPADQARADAFVDRIQRAEDLERQWWRSQRQVVAELLTIKRAVWAQVPPDVVWEIIITDEGVRLNWRFRDNAVKPKWETIFDADFSIVLHFLRQVDWELARRLRKARAVGRRK